MLEAAAPVLTVIDESDVLHAAQAGSLEALGELYRGRMVHATAWRLLRSRDDADDVLQDVFAGLPGVEAPIASSAPSPR